jgi:hypothetical protein
MIDYDNFTVDELNAYRELQRKVQLPILEFEDMADFPPLCLSVYREKNSSFMEKAWELWTAGNELLQTKIPDNFRPYAALEKEYSEEIKAAKKYMKSSNGNRMVAIDMYVKDNPSVEIQDSDRH